MKTKIKVEKNIPIPKSETKDYLDILRKIKVNESIQVPNRLRNTICSNLFHTEKKKKFCSYAMKLSGKSRIWRIR